MHGRVLHTLLKLEQPANLYNYFYFYCFTYMFTVKVQFIHMRVAGVFTGLPTKDATLVTTYSVSNQANLYVFCSLPSVKRVVIKILEKLNS